MDSHEYLARLTHPDLISALSSGHPPLHAGYILTLSSLIQLTDFIQLDSIRVIKLANIGLSFMTVWLFYLLAKDWFSQKRASWAALIVAFVPIFWVTNPTLLSESTYLFWFLLAIFASQNFLKKPALFWLVLSSLALYLAILTHQITLIYLPALISLLFRPKKSNWPLLVSGWAISLLLVQVTLTWLYLKQGMGFPQALSFTLTSKLADIATLKPLSLGLIRVLRNWVILLFRSFTPVLTFLGLVGVYKLSKRDRPKALVLLFWFLPSTLAAQWWDGLLMGRHLLLALFPLSLGVTYLLSKTSWRLVISAYLLLVSSGTTWLLNQPLPAVKTQQALEKLPGEGVVIASHFTRPWLSYDGQISYVNEPKTAQNFPNQIDQALADNQPVFVTSQALSDPYGVYAGPYLHPLSLSFRTPAKLDGLVQRYRLSPVATPSAQDHLTIYQITSEAPQPGSRPDSVSVWHRRRLDYFDPVSQLWFWGLKLLKLDTIPA